MGEIPRDGEQLKPLIAAKSKKVYPLHHRVFLCALAFPEGSIFFFLYSKSSVSIIFYIFNSYFRDANASKVNA
jgi:hypothetical protein